MDFYSSCQSDDTSSGTASIMVKDSAGVIKKLKVVNTKIAGLSEENAVIVFQKRLKMKKGIVVYATISFLHCKVNS